MKKTGVRVVTRPKARYVTVVNPASTRARRRDSEPPGLTPYQARLDVEMDDTAVSEVRDPSVSMSLELEAERVLLLPEVRTSPTGPLEPLYSVALGVVLGAILVALIALIVRFVTH